MDILKNIEIGNTAPDFGIEKGLLNMHQLQSDYTLLIFWASWCPHCTQVLPEIKTITDEFNRKQETENLQLITVTISLDTNQTIWQKYVQENSLTTWLNTSELKGWTGNVPKQYNVYATPTMFLLDKDKKIIAKPESVQRLINILTIENSINNQEEILLIKTQK